MPIRVRFNGPGTNNSTLTINWQGGYPPNGTASAVETFKTVRNSPFQTVISNDPQTQATNFLNAILLDYSVNFYATQIGNDVIINPKNGTLIISGTTSSPNIVFNPSVSQIQMLNSPQYFIPGYNPITSKFFSNKYATTGYRYLVDVYNNDTSEKIYSAKVAPQIDGTGYIDISKPITNFLTYDWQGYTSFINCPNSYINTVVKIGEEYQTSWQFNIIFGATGSTASSGHIQLGQTVASVPVAHTYQIGDQINIDTNLPSNSLDINVNGLHTVIAVPNQYNIIIDALKNTTTAGILLTGVSNYADGRKTAYKDVTTYGFIAFNGVRKWKDFPDWDYSKWFIEYGSTSTPQPQLLTSLRIASETYQNKDDHFYMTPEQELYFNFATDTPNSAWYVNWSANDINNTIITDGSFLIDNYIPATFIQQFMIRPDDLLAFLTPIDYNNVDSITFAIFDDSGSTDAVTRDYKVYLDKRCKIEKYELYFVDRMGSILSFACQLRANEKGTITRETSKRQVIYNELSNSYSNVYDLKDVGTVVNSINLSKEIELNTNWLNNEMSLLFEELLTSPQVWLKIVEPATNELSEKTYYVSVVVNETSFEVQKQKNKRLIRKTINVKMANEDIINI